MTQVWLPSGDDGNIAGLPTSLEVYVGSTPPAAIETVEFFVPGLDSWGRLRELIPQMTGLRVIQTLSAGVDLVPRDLLGPDVVLCNAAGVHDTAVAEMAATLILCSLRGIPDFLEAQSNRQWLQNEWTRVPQRTSLADHRVLIIGFGRIGAALERRLLPFECDVVKIARHPREGVLGLSELQRELPLADIVVLLVPLTTETEAIANTDFLARMKDGALLVNLGRGKLVDTNALIAELNAGRITAALDAVDPEPLPVEHPLWLTPGVMITPHIAGSATARLPRLHGLIREQLRRFASGESLLNVVSAH